MKLKKEVILWYKKLDFSRTKEKDDMKKICSWLFGEDEMVQKDTIKKLFYWTIGLLAAMIILLFIEPSLSAALIAVIFLMWGWRVVCATSKVNKITELFHYNVGVFAVILVLWLFFGYIAGMACFVIGIIRYIQLRKIV